MITSVFIFFGAILFQTLAVLLPASEGLPSTISNALIYIASAVNSVSYIVPVSALFDSLLIVVTYQAAMWIFRGVVWIWNKTPIIGK